MAEEKPKSAYTEPPFVGGSGGLSPAELAWHRSRRPQPVTGSAFALDPICIQTPVNGDVIQQLQMEEDEWRKQK